MNCYLFNMIEFGVHLTMTNWKIIASSSVKYVIILCMQRTTSTMYACVLQPSILTHYEKVNWHITKRACNFSMSPELGGRVRVKLELENETDKRTFKSNCQDTFRTLNWIWVNDHFGSWIWMRSNVPLLQWGKQPERTQQCTTIFPKNPLLDIKI